MPSGTWAVRVADRQSARRWLALLLIAGTSILGCATPSRQCDDKPTRASPWRAACFPVLPGGASTGQSAHAAGAADIPQFAGDTGGTTQPVCATAAGRCVVRFERVVPLGTACHCTSSGQRIPGVTVPGWDP